VIAARQDELYATEGSRVTLGCDTVEKQPIAYCRFLTPRLFGFAVDEKSGAQPPPRYAYSGQGLTAGHCGLAVDRVDDSDYGNWTCAVKILDSTGSEEVSTTILLRKPEGTYIIFIKKQNNNKRGRRTENSNCYAGTRLCRVIGAGRQETTFSKQKKNKKDEKFDCDIITF